MTTPNPATPLNVFTVEEYEAPTGKSGTSWTKIGVAFAHHDGPGLRAVVFSAPANSANVAWLMISQAALTATTGP